MQAGRGVPWGFLTLAALVLAAGLFVAQSGWLGGDADDGAEAALRAAVTPTGVDAVSGLRPTVTAAPAGSGGAATPTVPAWLQACGDNRRGMASRLEQPPPGAFASDPGFRVWYGERESALAIAPLDFTAVNSLLVDRGLHWFAGGRTPMLWHGAEEVLSVSAVPVGGTESERVVAEAGVFRNAQTQYLEITFPEAGCWEVTAEAADADVDVDVQATLLIAVAPREERPDFQYALSGRSAEPYAPPVACGAAAWGGPDDAGALGIAPWWIEAPDVALGSLTGVLWAEGESVFLLRWAEDGGAGVLTVRAVPAVGGSTLQATGAAMPSGLQSTVLEFPTAGCWDVTLGDDAGDLTTVAVYVFPADCRRESDATPVPEGCVVP